MGRGLAQCSKPGMEQLLAAMQQACMASARAHGCIAYVRERPTHRAAWGAADVLFQTGFDPACLASFSSYYHARNVWARQEHARMRPGITVASSDLYPDSLLPATEYYADWLKPQDIFYAMGGVVWAGTGNQIKLSVVRSRSRGPFSPEDVRVFQAIMPMVSATLMACEILSAAVREDDGLTGAEESVFGLLVQGFGAKDIARERSRSVTTVRTQIASLLGKFGCRSQRELLARHAADRLHADGPGFRAGR